MNKESIDNFVNEWFSETDKQQPQPIKSPQSSRRLTEKEIDDAFEEIKRLYEQSLENAHNNGKYR